MAFVVTPEYNNNKYKRLENICLSNRIEVIRTNNVNSNEVKHKLVVVSPELCVICHFEKLIHSSMLSIPEYGFINVHPSLLPNYRGMAPQHWPIINGEKKTGITVHYVDEMADTGDIIVQREIDITDDMYVSDLQKKWIEHYKTIVLEAINCIDKEKQTVKQKEMQGSYYGKLKADQCVISKNMTIKDVYNLIKGVSFPYFGATYESVRIYKAHIVQDNMENSDMGLKENDNNGYNLVLKDGILSIDNYVNINSL